MLFFFSLARFNGVLFGVMRYTLFDPGIGLAFTTSDRLGTGAWEWEWEGIHTTKAWGGMHRLHGVFLGTLFFFGRISWLFRPVWSGLV